MTLRLSRFWWHWHHRAGLSLSDRLCLAHWAIVLCGLAAFAFDGNVNAISLGVSVFLLLVCIGLWRQHALRMHGEHCGSFVIHGQRLHNGPMSQSAIVMALRHANRLAGAPPAEGFADLYPVHKR